MQFPTKLAKILSVLIAALSLFFSVTLGVTEPVLSNTNKANKQALQAVGGFMKGICHPDGKYKQLRQANIGWIRVDMPYPFDENGEQSAGYLAFKEEMADYVKHGIKVFAITPNPKSYLEHGLDIRKDEDIPKIEDVARFYIRDLQGLVGVIQVTNEMGIDRFMKPFTLKEAVKFMGVQMKAMHPLRGDILIGYNVCGLIGIAELPFMMMPYSKYFDYVGADLYFGCFENVFRDIEEFPAMLKMIHSVVRKPIILAEFGYIGGGEIKNAEEKKEMLRRYGVESEDEAKQDIDAFISRLPEPIREEFETNYKDMSDSEKAQLLFYGEYANHIYQELNEGTELNGYPHTPQGQAKFYTDLIPMLRKLDFCIGAFIYMWSDSERCYVCHEPDCPVETAWGLVDNKGYKKPAYYAVQRAFAK